MLDLPQHPDLRMHAHAGCDMLGACEEHVVRMGFIHQTSFRKQLHVVHSPNALTTALDGGIQLPNMLLQRRATGGWAL
jgi:hypothetical protein